MTSRLTVTLCAVLLAAAAACTPQRRPTEGAREAAAPVVSSDPARLPFSPFTKARVGDWSTMTVRTGHGKVEEPGGGLRTYAQAKRVDVDHDFDRRAAAAEAWLRRIELRP